MKGTLNTPLQQPCSVGDVSWFSLRFSGTECLQSGVHTLIHPVQRTGYRLNMGSCPRTHLWALGPQRWPYCGRLWDSGEAGPTWRMEWKIESYSLALVLVLFLLCICPTSCLTLAATSGSYPSCLPCHDEWEPWTRNQSLPCWVAPVQCLVIALRRLTKTEREEERDWWPLTYSKPSLLNQIWT